MKNIKIENKNGTITDGQIESALSGYVESSGLKGRRILLIPPDITRYHSGAGKITAILYRLLNTGDNVDIMPAIGTHTPVSDGERIFMYGGAIPKERFIAHHWRTDVVKIGRVPEEFVGGVSEGLFRYPIDVEVNKRLVSGTYDRILSIGQVVPHEVVGMSNYSKNIFVGCGGKSMIDGTHMLGAVYGIERILGRDRTPVRKVLDYAEENFIQNIPLTYILTVTTTVGDRTDINGFYVGRDREVFENAVALSQQVNFIFEDKPLKKVVVHLDEKEFKSTWLGNKSVYRTRMAIADGGELIVLAPGVVKFGEDDGNDRLIRKYGYAGREKILELFQREEDLQQNASVAAHLIHGSSDGRFGITYAVGKLSRDEVEGVGYRYAEYSEMSKKYAPERLKEGFNRLPGGEEIYYISNPALGLWSSRQKLFGK